MASSGTETLSGSLIAALGTIVVAVLGALAAYLATKRERRRMLYGESVRAVVRWNEMLYRVRRRSEGQDQALVQRFHDLQDDLNYYVAWIGAESPYMKRSFERFMGRVKGESESLIREAWATSPRTHPAVAPPDDANPDVWAHVDAFLKDVRSHLSPWPWRKLGAWWRNRSGGHKR